MSQPSPTRIPEESPVQSDSQTPTGLDAYHNEKIEPTPISKLATRNPPDSSGNFLLVLLLIPTTV